MLATSKNVLFPDHNHLLITDADDLTLSIAQALACLEVDSLVVRTSG